MRLTEERLRQLMTDLEADNVERTRAFDKADKMGQAICAFANDLPGRNVPGYLLLGVDNNGTITGKRIDDEHLTSLGGLKTEGNLLPPPAMALEVFHFPEGDVVVLTVFPSAYPPIRYQGQVWIRIGPRKALATDEDIHVLEERRQSKGHRFEELPCQAATIEDLDLDFFRTQYLPKALQKEVIEEDTRPIQEQLATLRLFSRAENVPTNLGMLLLGKHPEWYIPSAYLQYVKFSTADNAGDILTEQAYKGPLLKMVAELESFVRVGIASPRSVRISALQEITFKTYPDWSLRELLLNAIIHRDYQIGNAPIKFYDYNGLRLEISNPGGLYGQATSENFPFVNDDRNPLLAEAMKVMGYVNKFNRGIAKVKSELEKNGNPPPIFDYIKRTEFRVTLRPAKAPSEDGAMPPQSNWMVTSEGEISSASGITTQDGGITMPNGGNKAPDGGITTQDGGITMPNGGIKAPDGGIKAPDGGITTQDGGIKVPDGGITTQDGGIKVPDGGITTQDDGITMPNGGIPHAAITKDDGMINDQRVIQAIACHPGIKLKGLLEQTQIPLRTLERTLRRLRTGNHARIDYRGSKKTGGWFVKS